MTGSGSKPHCRPANASDARSIGPLVVAAWQQAYAGLVPKSFLESLDSDVIREKWQKAPHSNRVFRRVMTIENCVVGVLSGGPIRHAKSPPHMAELYSINVHPDHWGQGIGRKLLQCAENAMTDAGFLNATLWVMPKNTRAVRFYLDTGWIKTGTERHTSHLIGSSLHEISLSKRLTGA